MDQSAPKFQGILLVVITPRGFSVQSYFVHFTMAEFASNVLKSTIILKISSFSAEFMGRSLIAVAMNQFSFKNPQLRHSLVSIDYDRRWSRPKKKIAKALQT